MDFPFLRRYNQNEQTFSPIFVYRGLPMRSIGYRIAETAVRLTGYKRLFNLDAQGLSDYIAKTKGKRRTAPPRFIFRRHQTHEMTLHGRPCQVIAPKNASHAKRAVLFLHGGGMFMEAMILHWLVVSKLVQRLGAEVWLPAYPLAPERTFKDATEMLLAVYEKMLEQHPAKESTFLGDSAGAARKRAAYPACPASHAL
jgi:acetyl esterase/lipase